MREPAHRQFLFLSRQAGNEKSLADYAGICTLGGHRRMNRTVRQAFVETIPVMTGYLALGFGFGIMLKASGYPVWLAMVMSMVIYAGALQYIAVGLLSGGASLLTVGLTTFLVNARHVFYGISMLDKFKTTGKRTPYLIFALTDETYSLLCRETPDIPLTERKNYYFCICLFDHCYWIAGSVLGAVTGSLVPFNSQGIDFVLTALFITIFIEQWRSTTQHAPAIIGLVVTAICLALFGSESFLIASMGMILLLLCLYREEVPHG